MQCNKWERQSNQDKTRSGKTRGTSQKKITPWQECIRGPLEVRQQQQKKEQTMWQRSANENTHNMKRNNKPKTEKGGEKQCVVRLKVEAIIIIGIHYALPYLVLFPTFLIIRSIMLGLRNKPSSDFNCRLQKKNNQLLNLCWGEGLVWETFEVIWLGSGFFSRLEIRFLPCDLSVFCPSRNRFNQLRCSLCVLLRYVARVMVCEGLGICLG
jgi:hypothetical protein